MISVYSNPCIPTKPKTYRVWLTWKWLSAITWPTPHGPSVWFGDLWPLGWVVPFTMSLLRLSIDEHWPRHWLKFKLSLKDIPIRFAITSHKVQATYLDVYYNKTCRWLGTKIVPLEGMFLFKKSFIEALRLLYIISLVCIMCTWCILSDNTVQWLMI